MGVEEGIATAMACEEQGGVSERDQAVRSGVRGHDHRTVTLGFPGRLPGGEDIPTGPVVQGVQQIGDASEQVEAGLGVRSAERALDMVRERSHQFELGARKGVFGSIQQAVHSDGRAGSNGIVHVHGLPPP
ncbi:hypothetical protein [Streptomyces sp. WG5]|uniref:hypothetical protein n=1 Tax=Streptomyces sp. WG5 TaxID=3417648 RepID=UPI003CFB2522